MSNTRLASHHPLRITNFCQVHVRFSLGEVSCKGSISRPRLLLVPLLRTNELLSFSFLHTPTRIEMEISLVLFDIARNVPTRTVC